MDLNIDLNILDVEPAEQYHAKAREHLSSHQLLDFMKSPWLHRKKALGLIEDKDSPAYLVGRAAHVRILEGRDVYETSFALGTKATDLARLLAPEHVKALIHALRDFGKRLKGFDGPDGILLAPETRASCPVRILRDPESRQSVSFPGLYPIGEGAGYAGGITSAACDGLTTAQAIIATLAKP